MRRRLVLHDMMIPRQDSKYSTSTLSSILYRTMLLRKAINNNLITDLITSHSRLFVIKSNLSYLNQSAIWCLTSYLFLSIASPILPLDHVVFVLILVPFSPSCPSRFCVCRGDSCF